MDWVMARLADDDAVVECIETSEFGVTDMVGVGYLAKWMLRASGFTKAGDSWTAARTAELLPSQRKLLRRRREL